MKKYFSMGFFLKFNSRFGRIAWKWFQSVSDNINPSTTSPKSTIPKFHRHPGKRRLTPGLELANGRFPQILRCFSVIVSDFKKNKNIFSGFNSMYCGWLPLRFWFWSLSSEREPSKEPNETSKIRKFHRYPGRCLLAPASYLGYPHFFRRVPFGIANWMVYIAGNTLKLLPSDSPEPGVVL